MANVFYDDTFREAGLRVRDSLFETLYRLEEHYWGLREGARTEVNRAAKWLQDQVEGRGERIQWQRTGYDRDRMGGYRLPDGQYRRLQYVKLPTGEGAVNLSLAFPAVLLALAPRHASFLQDLRHSFLQHYPAPAERPELLRLGRFCCASCNSQYQRALARAAPDMYARQEAAFMRELRRQRGDGNRWRGYPFYYTVLSLHDIGTDRCRRELGQVARKAKPRATANADRADRPAPLRARALEVLSHYR